ncbi:MAG: dipeptidase [Rikenellaceae bacterium]|nr:dipeptidase [Rikenellaceae bacterium]
MTEGHVDALFTVAYLPQGTCDPKGHAAAKAQALESLDTMRKQIDAHPALVGQAVRFSEAQQLKREGRKALFLGLENGYALGRDLAALEEFRNKGVVYVTLCHNGDNAIGDSALGTATHGGLSPFGRQVVRRMNRLGMVIDLSHAASDTFYDVLEESRHPVICSHSSARALCDHPRNLTNEQLRALAAKGGVVQVCLYGGFLAAGREATLADAVAHIEHIVRIAGIHSVGIGSDFDGGGGIRGCRGPMNRSTSR